MAQTAEINGVSSDRMAGSGTLKKSLKLLYVYALATGSILTFIGYWDGVFLTVAGPAAFLSFFLMTMMVLPIAFVYSEIAAMLPTCGAELVYCTVGLNKHWGFWSTWFIMAAWIAVPPAAVMGIIDWINHLFKLNMSFNQIMITGVIVLIIYCGLSMWEIKIAGGIQTVMLFAALFGVLLTGILFLFSSQWSWSNFDPFIRSAMNNGGATGEGGMLGWAIGTALIVGPYFGFETVPNLVEEGTFPIKDMSKAILGSVLTCGAIYVFFFFALAGMGPWEKLTEGGTSAPFVAIKILENDFGWAAYAVFFGITAVFFTISTCLLGFWLSSVRMLYAMGRQNFLPKIFARTNRHAQPIVPNLLILGLGVGSLFLMNATTYLQDFYCLMAFACAVAYAITMAAAVNLGRKHPDWERPYAPVGHKSGSAQGFRIFAFLVALFIAWLCTLGQGWGAWKGLLCYCGLGCLLWLWMIVAKWSKEPVWMSTPEGEVDY